MKGLFQARRVGEENWTWVQAETADKAAERLIEHQECGAVEYPIASGHESATVEVQVAAQGVVRFIVEGDSRPQYRATQS